MAELIFWKKRQTHPCCINKHATRMGRQWIDSISAVLVLRELRGPLASLLPEQLPALRALLAWALLPGLEPHSALPEPE
jgi:hypothetical protein